MDFFDLNFGKLNLTCREGIMAVLETAIKNKYWFSATIYEGDAFAGLVIQKHVKEEKYLDYEGNYVNLYLWMSIGNLDDITFQTDDPPSSNIAICGCRSSLLMLEFLIDVFKEHPGSFTKTVYGKPLYLEHLITARDAGDDNWGYKE